MPAERPMLKTNENRRSNKPIMEKRRRARINSCLNELKALILEALKKDPARHSKLEKADILEMTVKHLQNLQRQQIALQTASNPNVTNKFRAGYHECANEVSRYLRHMDGLDPGSQQRLLNHLSNCIEFLNRSEFKSVIRSTASTTQPLNIRVTSLLEAPIGQLTPLPTPNGMDKSSNNTLVPSVGFHLLPTRMVNGEFALVLPAGAANSTTAIPTCTVVRNRIQDANDRLNPGSNLLAVAPIISRAMMSPFCVSADENSFEESGCPKSLHAASSSPIDLCGGSAGREHRMVTSKEPWRPW